MSITKNYKIQRFKGSRSQIISKKKIYGVIVRMASLKKGYAKFWGQVDVS